MTEFVSPGRSSVEELLARFPCLRVAVVGDLMLDQFVYGTVERISPEAPVPVVEVDREVFRLGGAANVVHNLRTLGAEVVLVGVVGADEHAEAIRREVRALGLSCEGLVEVHDRPTALKTRIIAHHQQMVRFDREKRGPLPEQAVHRIRAHLQALDGLGAIVVSDYGKGVVDPRLMEPLVRSARAAGTLVCVDPKPQNGSCYIGADAATPNAKEAEAMTGVAAGSDEEAAAAGRELLRRLRARAVLVTRGERGMTLVESGGDVTHIPTLAREVFDVTGAGDTAISAFTLAWAAGGDLKLAARLANVAAGVVVGKLGTSTVSGDELRQAARNGFPGGAGGG
jgi:rfaE bifunctional protein kinase chain/domain